jgi:hypothetical protein
MFDLDVNTLKILVLAYDLICLSLFVSSKCICLT